MLSSTFLLCPIKTRTQIRAGKILEMLFPYFIAKRFTANDSEDLIGRVLWPAMPRHYNDSLLNPLSVMTHNNDFNLIRPILFQFLGARIFIGEDIKGNLAWRLSIGSNNIAWKRTVGVEIMEVRLFTGKNGIPEVCAGYWCVCKYKVLKDVERM